MLSECPGCGQKLRPQWVRCPRCRALLPQSQSDAADLAATPESPAHASKTLWLTAAGIAAVVVVVAAVILPEEAAPPPARAQAVTVPPDDSDADAPELIDETTGAPATNFRALDSKQAGRAAYTRGDFASALAAMEAAVEAAPSDADARNALGQLLVRNGRAAESLQHFDEAVRLVTDRWEYRFNRARALGLLNRWDDAVAEYRVAAQLFPEDHATLYNLGLALLRVRDYAAAAATLEQAVAAAPEQHDFLITLGTAYVGAARPERARATFQRFLELAPDDVEAPKVKALLQSLAEAAP